MTFDRPILGIMVFDETLDLADPVLALASTIYRTGLRFRGTELSNEIFRDAITLSADGRTLSIDRLGVDGVHDQMRVLTAAAVPLPAAAWLFAACLPVLRPRKATSCRLS